MTDQKKRKEEQIKIQEERKNYKTSKQDWKYLGESWEDPQDYPDLWYK